MQSCYSPLQLLLLDCIRFNCSLIASASTAPRLRPLQLLLPICVQFSCTDCVHFSCCSLDCVCFNCSPIASPSATLPDCVRFNCCSPIASASQILRISCSGRFQPMPCQSPMFSNILRRVRGSVNCSTKVARR